MISELQVHDRADHLLCYLDQGNLSVFKRSQSINNTHALDLELSTVDKNVQYMKKYNKIVYKDTLKDEWFEFTIAKVDRDLTKVSVYCESSLYETLSSVVESAISADMTVTSGLNMILQQANPPSNFSAGTSDILGNYSLSVERMSLKEAIYEWANAVGGELEEKIEIGVNGINRVLKILNHVGESRGKTVYDDREIETFNLSVPIDDYFTAAYAYGASTDDVPLTIANVDWNVSNGDPVDKPLGQNYVSLSEDKKTQYGFYRNSTCQDRMTIFNDSSIKDDKELIASAYKFLIENLLEKTSYSLTATDLAALGYGCEQINLGDEVKIVISAMDLKLQTRVVKVVEDYLNSLNNEFEFNFSRKLVTESIKQTASLANKALLAIEKNYQESILKKFNNEINSDEAYVYATSSDGVNTYDAADPDMATKATSIKGGSVRIANSKISTDEWDWRTLITGDGIVADEIYTGTIHGNNFDLDLTSGELKFGPRQENGDIDTVMQFTVDGFNIVGESVDAVFSSTELAYKYKIDQNNSITIASYNKDGATMSNAIIENQLNIDKTRITPYTNGTKKGIVISVNN